MPELMLLQLDKAEFDQLGKLAAIGDEAALSALETLRRGNPDGACFLCNDVVGENAFQQLLPEYDDRTKLLVAPLCANCGGLPNMQRWGRCLKMLKLMWSVRSGKYVTFSFTPSRRPKHVGKRARR
jgi:hypothetical protein